MTDPAIDDVCELRPIGYVRTKRKDIEDDNWGGIRSHIELTSVFDEEALVGLEAFSHVEIVYYFDRVDPAKIVSGARHPRNNPDWPRVGIFAQRGKNRPNRLGLTIARLIEVSGTTLVIEGLDAIDGTPVLDIKPVMREFLPVGAVRQPDWATQLMDCYWDVKGG